MASGAAIGVTVVGVVAIVGLLGLLGRYLGLWTWAWTWIRASREEKVKLCRSERTTSGRSYLFDNDLDWIGLWPRTGSYKRFTNLDDVTSMVTLDESVRPPEEPDLPPQPLRPAPAPPPSRMPGGWTDSGEGSPSPASSSIGLGAGVETPPEPSRPAPVLDRRDSNRSLSGRIQRRDSSKELLVSSQQSSPKRSSTNPFRASWVPPDEASEGAYVEEASHDVFSASSRRAPSGTGRGAVSSGAERVNEEMQRAPASNALPEKPDAKAAVPTMASVTQGSDTVVDWFGGGAGDRAGGINVTSSGGTGWFTGTNNQGISSGGVSSVVSTGSGSSWLSGLTGINSSVGVTSSGGVSGVGGVISNSVGDVAGNRETSGGVVAQAGNVHTSTVYDNSLNYKPLQPDSLLNRINETKDTSIFGNQNYYTTTDYTKPESVAGTGVSATTTLYSNQISTTTNAETVSSAGAVPGLLLPSRDPVLPSDFGGATDVPATPPNTATFDPSSPSPYITSRLAEVEARIGLLGARQQEEEQSTPLGSAQVEGGRRTEGGKNPFLVLGSGEADRKGLSAVEEEVSLLHDAVDTSRTQPLVQPHSELGSETSKSVLGGERSPRGETKEEEKKETGEMEKEKKKEEEEEETEEDASTRRVREYIASLSARLRQIPDDSSIGQDSLSQMRTPPPSAAFPITPPNSAARLSGETPPSSAGLYTPFGSRPPSSSTPPSSATGLRNLYSSRRASADASPLSPVVFTLSTSRRLSLDTPPSSADLVTATPPNSASSQAVFGETPPSSAGYSSTPPNSAGLAGAFEGGVSAGMLKRAMSCDSVSSDTSVTLGELEDTCGQVTGHLAIQLIYDSDTADLEVVVVEARDLVGPDPHVAVDSYVRVFLLPDKSTNMQTRVCRRTNHPTYRERFLFALEEEELPHRSLAFYMYASDKFTNTLIGEAHLKLTDVDLTGPFSATVPLTDMGQRGVGYGEIMFSLSYLPTAERLTVVVVKARSLQWTDEKEAADPFVKVYVLQNGKKVMKKKTSVKKDTRSPVFNEAMIFSVPAPALHNIQLRVTVAEHSADGGQARAVGHVIVGTQATGKALSHWNQMMSALRKPIGMWHPLRR